MQMPPAAYLADNERFKRLAEPKGGVLCQGGYGKVFQGYDVLLGQQVTIKRQSSEDESADSEAASYRMLKAYSHPNIIRMKRDVRLSLLGLDLYVHCHGVVLDFIVEGAGG